MMEGGGGTVARDVLMPGAHKNSHNAVQRQEWDGEGARGERRREN